MTTFLNTDPHTLKVFRRPPRKPNWLEKIINTIKDLMRGGL